MDLRGLLNLDGVVELQDKDIQDLVILQDLVELAIMGMDMQLVVKVNGVAAAVAAVALASILWNLILLLLLLLIMKKASEAVAAAAEDIMGMEEAAAVVC